MSSLSVSPALKNFSGKDVRIAVLDSGLNLAYSAFRGRTYKIFDCRHSSDGLVIRPLPSDVTCDRNGHGSAVQSCIVTAAPEASIDHYRILDENNNSSSTLLCHVLDHVIEERYHIVNLSLGTRNDAFVPWLVTIMKRAYERNVVIVAASSNMGNCLYPARFTYCISCDAMPGHDPLQLRFHAGSVVEFSGWGINVPVKGAQDVSLTVSGSSYAAGHVTGLAARAVQYLSYSSPHTATPLDVKLVLRDYALAQTGQWDGDGGPRAGIAHSH